MPVFVREVEAMGLIEAMGLMKAMGRMKGHGADRDGVEKPFGLRCFYKRNSWIGLVDGLF